MSDDNGLDPNTFPIFGFFSFVLFMTPVLKWIYVNVMREYAFSLRSCICASKMKHFIPAHSPNAH
jgi:hypothetical protein